MGFSRVDMRTLWHIGKGHLDLHPRSSKSISKNEGGYQHIFTLGVPNSQSKLKERHMFEVHEIVATQQKVSRITMEGS